MSADVHDRGIPRAPVNENETEKGVIRMDERKSWRQLEFYLEARVFFIPVALSLSLSPDVVLYQAQRAVSQRRRVEDVVDQVAQPLPRHLRYSIIYIL